MKPRILVLCVLIVTFGSSAWADTVYLKTGGTIRGRVIERGTVIEVLHVAGGASLRIPKNQILKIEMDEEVGTPTRSDVDQVLTKAGGAIKGKVRLTTDKKTVIIEGKHGTTSLPMKEVHQIIWAEEQAASLTDAKDIRTRVASLLDALKAGDQTALDELKKLGLFAIPYLEESAPSLAPATRTKIERILQEAHLRSATDPEVYGRIPDIINLLMNPDPKIRKKALEDAIMASPKGSIPLVIKMVEIDDDANIRGQAIQTLTEMGNHQGLLDLLQRPDGQIRLAAAIGLGENGILLGIPILISALGHPQLKIRSLANNHLKSFIPEAPLVFFPEESEEVRTRQLARWESWWKINGEPIVDRSLKATIQTDRITAKDKQKGIKFWKAANQLWNGLNKLTGKKRLETAHKIRHYLKMAIQVYPTFTSAWISMGILSYSELANLDQARKELETVCRLYLDGTGTVAKVQAHFHLAVVLNDMNEWDEAVHHLQRASLADPTNPEVLVALGDVVRDRAMGDQKLELKEVRTLFEESLGFYGRALELQDQALLQLNQLKRKNLKFNKQPFKSGSIQKSIQRHTKDSKKQKADTLFTMSRLNIALGNRAQALVLLNKAHRFHPEDLNIQKAITFWKNRALSPKRKSAKAKP